MIPDIKLLKNTGSGNFFLIAGPCVIGGEVIKLKVEMPERGPGGDGMEMTLKKAEE